MRGHTVEVYSLCRNERWTGSNCKLPACTRIKKAQMQLAEDKLETKMCFPWHGIRLQFALWVLRVVKFSWFRNYELGDKKILNTIFGSVFCVPACYIPRKYSGKGDHMLSVSLYFSLDISCWQQSGTEDWTRWIFGLIQLVSSSD